MFLKFLLSFICLICEMRVRQIENEIRTFIVYDSATFSALEAFILFKFEFLYNLMVVFFSIAFFLLQRKSLKVSGLNQRSHFFSVKIQEEKKLPFFFATKAHAFRAIVK